MIRSEQDHDGFLGGLLERYAPGSKEFMIVLSKGDYFKFRHVSGYDELVALRAKARDFMSVVSKGEHPPDWSEFLSSDKDTLLYVFHISELNTEVGTFAIEGQGELKEPVYTPSGKLSALDVLKIAKLAPHLFDALKMGLDERMHVAAVAIDAEGVRRAEKKSSATGSGGCGSPPVATSGDGIQKS